MHKINFALQYVFLIAFILLFMPLIFLNGYILTIGIIAFISYFLIKKDVKHFTIISFLIGLILRVIIIFLINPPVQSDFSLLFNAAQSALQGDFSFRETAYFYLWGYQSGFIAWEMLWLSIWNSETFLKLINAILVSGTITLLYRILKQYVTPVCAKLSTIILHIMPFLLLYHTVLNNQIPSLFFIVLAVWLIFCNDCKKLKYFRFPLAGISLQISNILRPEAIVIIVALIAFLIFEIFKYPEKTKNLIFKGILLGIFYVVLGLLADWLIRKSGLSLVGLKNMFPGWKFVCGFNQETNGQYSRSLWSALSETFSGGTYITNETISLQNEIIRNELAQPIDVIILLFKKVYLLWDTSPLVLILNNIASSDLYLKLAELNRGIYYISFILSLVGLIGQIKFKLITSQKLIFWFIPFSFTCAMLLVEIQPRYTYVALPFLVISSAFGFERLFYKIQNIRNK